MPLILSCISCHHAIIPFCRYAAASPIITVFATGYFLFVWAFWRFAVLYYFERCYESGGRMFEVIFSQASSWTVPPVLP